MRPERRKEVAVKVLSASPGRSPKLRERFVREGRTAARLRHPNIARCLDSGETEEGQAYLVMELVHGEPLSARLAGGALDVRTAARLASEMAAALSHAHANGIIHRDLKPANVMLEREEGRDESVKLVDFGLAHALGERGLTATGELCGTPAYMSPEQADGQPITPAADLYSLGCVLFEMVCGRPPFAGSTPAVLDAHVDAIPPGVSTLAPGATALDQVVAKLLEKAPSRRGTADSIAEDLLRIARGR
jgi:eukaryotic-like serine/threonine-protein kinase